MDRKINKILTACRGLTFGTFPLGNNRTLWQKAVNDEMTSLCRGLPKSQQASALIFLMNYSSISIGSEMNFFQNYFPPSWTILSHLAAPGKNPGPENFLPYIRAHAMAMFLHSLEDHLVDKEIPPDNLTLLLHGEAWHRYRSALKKIVGEDQARRKLVENHLDRYFASINSEPEEASIEGYCRHFRNQMATWTVTPLLMKEKKVNDLAEAYESFGIAWRLLDDLNDLEDDILQGTRNACYYILEEQWRNLYDNQEDPRDYDELIKHLTHAGHLETIISLVRNFLFKGSSAARRAGVPAFGEELEQMALPITKALEDQ